MNFNPESYGPAAPLLVGAKCNELGPGKPDESRRAVLRALDTDSLFPDGPRNREMAKACLAGLWLRHDFLDESHRISQDISSPTGSYWHGIMHRREPDFSNSKYWFRRVGEHPIFEALAQDAADLVGDAEAGSQFAGLNEASVWDPFKFVDLCQQALDGPPAERQLCMSIQQREWELLFDYCYREANGSCS